MLLFIVMSLGGFVLLYYGAGWLVKGSSSLSNSMGVRPVVVGLTVVAFGTSAPELVVSIVSVFKGKSMIAVGNVVGSNICNIALVLGLTALFSPIRCDSTVIKQELPIMLGVSLYLLLLSLNSVIGRIEGATLFGGMILYILYNYRQSGRGTATGTDRTERLHMSEGKAFSFAGSRLQQLLMIVTGIVGVVMGAHLVVDSAEKIMRVLGVSEKFIGLTIVAFGTSFPELATSMVAVVKKEMDISIGNLVGSNIFNILSVLGLAALLKPISIPEGFFGSGLWIDYLVMMGTSALPLLLMKRTSILTRAGGLTLLVCYAGYIGYLIIGD